MKKSSILLMATTVMMLSCGTAAHYSSSDSGRMFHDGIYNNATSLRTKAEKERADAETDALIEATKASEIYLFGDRKDTVMIPENMYAKIQYDQKIGSTVVTIGENPYDWRYDLENNYGYHYSPYSIYNSWYWNRGYHNWYRYTWTFTPFNYIGWYDPFWLGGWYDPYYYGGFYSGWYAGWGWYDPYYGMHPHYCGWYGGWGPGFHHHGGHYPHHEHPALPQGHDRWYGPRHSTGSERIFTSGGSMRRGTGSSLRSSRNTIAQGGSSVGVRTNSGTGRTSSARSVRISGDKTIANSTASAAIRREAGGRTSAQYKPSVTVPTNHRKPAVTSSGLSSYKPSTNGTTASPSGKTGTNYYRRSSSDNKIYNTTSGRNSDTSSYNRSSSSNSSSYRSNSSSSSRSSGFSSGGSSGYSRGASGGSSGSSGRSGGSRR